MSATAMTGKSFPAASGWVSILRGQSSALTHTAELVRPRLAHVDRIIAEHLEQGPGPVRESGAWVLQAGGKRLRPTVLLAASRAVGYEGDSDVIYAAVVEMIHTATLVHDDIIDHATVRRGRPTANSRWGDQLAVLLGDWLFMSAMEMALALGDYPALRLLSRATMRMTEGEVLALALQGRLDVDQAQYLEITERKTADLFAAACAIPATLVPTRPSFVEPLQEYGRNLGICFQIVDDLLDITSSQDSLGKPVFSDLREGRLTLPFLLMLPNLDAREREKLGAYLQGAPMDTDDIKRLRGQLEETGSLAAARQIATAYGERAAAALAPLPAGREKDALAAAPILMLDRTS
jgi:octaprenyl-diphosphate synthase